VSIHVFALRVAAVVTDNDTVWIYDGCDPKLEHFTHLVADNLSGEQEIYETVQDETCMCLTAVLTSDNDDYWLELRSPILTPIRDLEQRDIDVAIGVTQ